MARDSVLTRVATGAAVGGAIGGAVGEDLLPLFPVWFRCKTDSCCVLYTMLNTAELSLCSQVVTYLVYISELCDACRCCLWDI